MKIIRKIKASLLLSLLLTLGYGVGDVNAATFTLNPDAGTLVNGETFIIDILIDSEGDEIIQATAVLTFDPSLVQIVKAERNSSLFATYPDGNQSTDNENGVLMLTGFSQSGAAAPYKTTGEPDVFARVTFTAINEGELRVEWEYTGFDDPFKTIMLSDGSPPQNTMDGEPAAGRYAIQDADKIAPGSVVYAGISGIDDVYIGIAIFIASLILGTGIWIYARASDRLITSNKKTIVHYSDE